MKPPTLAQRILAVLAESPLPCPTPDLIAILATGLTNSRQRVWSALRDLERDGLVVRSGRLKRSYAGSGHTITYWVAK